MIEIYDIEQLQSEIGKLMETRELDRIRETFLESIMDWTDHYSENLLTDCTEEDRRKALNSISKIWIQYANMEINEKQYKKAALVFEKALEDTVAMQLVDIYLAYSSFCESRGKLSNSRNILVRGLSSQLDPEKCDKIWLELLKIMRKEDSDTLTLQLLYEAVKLEKGVVTPPSESILKSMQDNLSLIESKVEEVAIDIDIKSDKQNKEFEALAEKVIENVNFPVVVSQIHRDDMVAHDVGSTGLTSEQLIKTYSKRPPMLFGINKGNDTQRIQNICGQELIDMETFLGEKLDTNITGSKLNQYLDLLESLWTTQALKERHFNAWYNQLKDLHIEEERKLIASTGSRNQQFEEHCMVQNEVLNCYINFTLMTLLIEQQTILSKICFPRFTSKALESLKKRYDSAEVLETIKYQKQLVCAVLFLRMDPSKGNIKQQTQSTNDDAALNDYYSQESKSKRRKRRHQDLNISQH